MFERLTEGNRGIEEITEAEESFDPKEVFKIIPPLFSVEGKLHNPLMPSRFDNGRIDGSITIQFYPLVTFGGKAGTGTYGDVNGTITYNESGAVVVLTGGKAVAGTYNYDKSTDTWITEVQDT